jgi:hypothetical protein
MDAEEVDSVASRAPWSTEHLEPHAIGIAAGIIFDATVIRAFARAGASRIALTTGGSWRFRR